MSTPFLGTVKSFPFNYAPKGWAMCNGQLMSIQTNAALFSLLGITYGGNGQTTFALPNLQGRFALSTDFNSYQMGQVSGENTHTLTVSEMPSHVHVPVGSTDPASTGNPTGAYPAVQPSASGVTPYIGSASTPVALANGSSNSTGGGQGHENRPPFLTLNFCIALTGIFPSRN
jgi:microcystin-dependent protein